MADVIRETCEGSGRPSGWTEFYYDETSGSANWDYTAAPLSGSKSLRLTTDGERSEYYNFSAQSTLYAFFTVMIGSVGSALHTTFFSLYDSGPATLLSLLRNGEDGGAMYLWNPTDGGINSSYVLNASTKYFIWVEYNAAGAVKVWINTSSTKPASPVINYTTGQSNAVSYLEVYCGYDADILFDDILASTAPIGSDPFAAASIFTQSIAGSLPALAGSLVRGTSKALAGSLLIGTGNNTKFITKHPVGSISLATGSAIKKSIRTVSGALPAQTGVIVKRAGKSLLGYVPFQSGVIVKGTNKIVSGSVPAQDGDIVKDIARMLSGNVPALSGSAVKKTSKTTQGTIPSASGLLAKMTAKVLSGSLPYSVGSIVKSTLKSLSGNFPAQEGDPGIGTMFNEVLAGIVPAITGGVAKLTSRGLAGVFPALSGVISRRTGKGTAGTLSLAAAVIKKDIGKIVAGQVPSQTGSVDSDSVFLQNESGTVPAPSGGISKRTGKGLAGNYPNQTGSVKKNTAMSRSGSVPSPSGSPGPTYHTSESTSGIMGTISGIVDGIIVIVDFTRKAVGIIGSRLRKIIGG